ncbi:MAG: transcriptional regulator, ArsR family [Nocardia sp.]|nr:transcriptional regulator, ArsR family [Nocardia sp.]
MPDRDSTQVRLTATRIHGDRRDQRVASPVPITESSKSNRLTNPDTAMILRFVPKYHGELDALLRALADPTRRAIVERLAKSPAVVSELAAPFSMALPSLMQHLRVLEDAGLVTSHKLGRVRTVSLRPGALDVLHLWLGELRTPAEHQADRLGIHLTRTTSKET